MDQLCSNSCHLVVVITKFVKHENILQYIFVKLVAC